MPHPGEQLALVGAVPPEAVAPPALPLPYDQGKFTPTIFGATTAGVTTYLVQKGFWNRIGNRVFFNLHVQWSAVTGTGQLSLGGLPFPAANDADNYAAHSLYYNGADTAHSYMLLQANGASSAAMYGHIASSGIVLVAIPASGDLFVSGSYTV